MSGFTCGECGAEHAIFGKGRLEEHAAEAGLDILGKIPMDVVTAVAADSGQPIVVAAPESAAAKHYEDLANRLWTQISADKEGATPTDERFKQFFEMKPK